MYIDSGPYIGRLAESLGVFDGRWRRDLFWWSAPTDIFELKDLRLTGMVPQEGPPAWSPVDDRPHVPRRITPVHQPRPVEAPGAAETPSRVQRRRVAHDDDLATRIDRLEAVQQ